MRTEDTFRVMALTLTIVAVVLVVSILVLWFFTKDIYLDAYYVLETFFDVHAVVAQRPFEWEGARLEAVSTIHVSGPRRTMHSYGLLIGDGEHRTLLTTDTQYTPGHLSAPYASADLIFHDCETGDIKTGVHAHYDDLVYLPPAVRAKTWLYGYQPGALPDAVADGFRGFIQPGQAFELGGHAGGSRASQEEKCDA